MQAHGAAPSSPRKAADKVNWACQHCEFKENYLYRAECFQCGRPRNAAVPAPKSPGAGFAAGKGKNKSSVAAPTTPPSGAGASSSTVADSLARWMVLDQKKRCAAATSAPPAPGATQEEVLKQAQIDLKAQIDEVDSKIVQLTKLGADSDIEQLLASKRVKKEQLLAKLRLLKPWKQRVQAALDARDRAMKRVQSARDQYAELQRLLESKAAEIVELETTASALAKEAKEVANKAAEEDSMPAPPLVVPPCSDYSPAQWAAGLMGSLPQEQALLFSRWLEETTMTPGSAGPDAQAARLQAVAKCGAGMLPFWTPTLIPVGADAESAAATGFCLGTAGVTAPGPPPQLQLLPAALPTVGGGVLALTLPKPEVMDLEGENSNETLAKQLGTCGLVAAEVGRRSRSPGAGRQPRKNGATVPFGRKGRSSSEGRQPREEATSPGRKYQRVKSELSDESLE